MIAAQVPELADGGFWVVVPVVEFEPNAFAPAGLYPDGFTATYLEGGHVLVRSPGIPTAPPGPATPDLPATRPYGRIGGL